MSKTRPVWGARMYSGIIHPCTVLGRPLLAGSAAHLQSSAPVACPFQGSTANNATQETALGQLAVAATAENAKYSLHCLHYHTAPK